MRHEWIFDVLEDLKSYAAMNGLEETAAKAEAALQAARTEVRQAVPEPAHNAATTKRRRH